MPIYTPIGSSILEMLADKEAVGNFIANCICNQQFIIEISRFFRPLLSSEGIQKRPPFQAASGFTVSGKHQNRLLSQCLFQYGRQILVQFFQP